MLDACHRTQQRPRFTAPSRSVKETVSLKVPDTVALCPAVQHTTRSVSSSRVCNCAERGSGKPCSETKCSKTSILKEVLRKSQKSLLKQKHNCATPHLSRREIMPNDAPTSRCPNATSGMRSDAIKRRPRGPPSATKDRCGEDWPWGWQERMRIRWKGPARDTRRQHTRSEPFVVLRMGRLTPLLKIVGRRPPPS